MERIGCVCVSKKCQNFFCFAIILFSIWLYLYLPWNLRATLYDDSNDDCHSNHWNGMPFDWRFLFISILHFFFIVVQKVTALKWNHFSPRTLETLETDYNRLWGKLFNAFCVPNGFSARWKTLERSLQAEYGNSNSAAGFIFFIIFRRPLSSALWKH